MFAELAPVASALPPVAFCEAPPNAADPAAPLPEGECAEQATTLIKPKRANVRVSKEEQCMRQQA